MLNKQTRRILLICTLLLMSASLLTACFSEDKPQPAPPLASATAGKNPTANATPVATTEATQRATQGDAEQEVAPEITLALNGSRDAEILQGWPLILETSLSHPDAMSTLKPVMPITVGAQGHPWSEAVHISVVNAAGKQQSWPLALATKPAGEATLDSDNVSSIYWSLTVEQTASIPEGVYSLSAALDTTKLPGGWRGTSQSILASVSITKAPSALTPEQQALRARLMANEALLKGDNARAQSYVDAQLASQPDDIGALELKGDILAQAGQTSQALKLYSRAIEIFNKTNPDAEEPPFALISKQHDILDKLLAGQ